MCLPDNGNFLTEYYSDFWCVAIGAPVVSTTILRYHNISFNPAQYGICTPYQLSCRTPAFYLDLAHNPVVLACKPASDSSQMASNRSILSFVSKRVWNAASPRRWSQW